MEEEKPENINLFTPEFLKKMGGMSPKKIAFLRRMELIETYVKKYGLNVSRKFTKRVMEDYHIGKTTVYDDWDWIKGNINPEDLQQVKIDLKIIRGRALEEAMEYLATATGPERAIAIKTAMDVAKQYREELEAWGEKGKVPDYHKIQVEPKQKPVVFQIIKRGTNGPGN